MLSLKSAPEITRLLADRVKARRLRRGWTQGEMARRAGLKAPTYVLFERTGQISVLRLIKVLDALDLVHEFERIGAEQDLHGLSVDDLVKPQRQRGRRVKP